MSYTSYLQIYCCIHVLSHILCIIIFSYHTFPESFAVYLINSNVPIPQEVTSLIVSARNKEEKEAARKNANQTYAKSSRSCEKDLLDDLKAAYVKLREEVLILSHLPDPVVTISVDGKIKFCNVQIEKALNYHLEDLVGLNIEDLLVPSSRGPMRRLIQELIASEGGEQKRNTKSVSCDSESMEILFPAEVDVSANGKKIASGNTSEASSGPSSRKDGSSFTHKSSSLTEDNDSLTDEFADDESSVPGKG